jgi:3-oxoacyl-[acyl-carrier protein] reductase
MTARAGRPVMLVTGARKGIGRFLAERFAGRGFDVVGCSRQPSDLAAASYTHLQADVTDEKQVVGLLAEIGRRFGRLDAAVNNAGIASMNHVLLTPGDTALRILKTNFLGTFLVCREAAKLMMKARRGRIVNFSTVAVPLDLEGEAAYAASKSAVESLTRILAHELGSFGITVNAVGPAPVATDLVASVPREKIDALVGRLALKRLNTLEDVGRAVEFLVADETDYLTGQTLYLGGP